jgi:predicted GNAT family N-acyltransferase
LSIGIIFRKYCSELKKIGRELLSRAVQKCISTNPELTELTVNSSPNAVSAYRALGFVQSGEEKTVNGIRFVPMSLKIDTLNRQKRLAQTDGDCR